MDGAGIIGNAASVARRLQLLAERSAAHGGLADPADQVRAIAARGDRAASGLVATHGNHVDILTGAAEFVPRVVADIGGAERQVNVSMYAFQPGAPGGIAQRVADALADKARQAVPVTLMVDAVGSGRLTPSRAEHELRGYLRDAGVEVRTHRLTPGRAGHDDARFATDHRKQVEVDGRIAYGGGINFVDGWESWHDAMLRVEGPVAAQTGALLAGRWHDLGGTVTDRRVELLAGSVLQPHNDSQYAVRQLSSGNRHRREITEHDIGLLAGARERIWLANPYLGDARPLGQAVDAARAGLDVQLFLTPKAGATEDIITDPLRRAWAHEVAQAGGQVHVLPTFSHFKGKVVDSVFQAGSANLDRFSTRRNYEADLLTDDPAVVREAEELFGHQRDRATLADAGQVDEWASVARWRRRLGAQF